MGLNVGGEFKPFFKLTTPDGDITNKIAHSLQSFILTETVDEESDRLTIIIARPENLAVPKLGQQLELSLGFQNYQVLKGVFVVSNVSLNGNPGEIGITAYSTPFNDQKQAVALQSQKTRAFDKKTLGDIIKTVAADNKLDAKIDEKFIAQQLDHIIQMDESDLNFCNRMALKYGSGFKIANDSLLFKENYTGKTASGVNVPPIQFIPSMLASWSATFGSRYTAKTIKAKYHDKEAGITQTFQLGSGEPVISLPFTYASEAEATFAAESRRKESVTADDSIDLTLPVIINVLALNAGGKMILTDFDPVVDGAWYAKTLEYSYSSAGFTLHINGVNELVN